MRHSSNGICVLAAIAALAFGAGDARAATGAWEFDVSLDDKPIGTHRFDIRPDGDQVVFETEARFDVKLFFITAFRYRHRNTEIWRDGCVASIDANTNSNGRRFEVTGARDDDRFGLETASGSTTLDGCVRTFAYWNPAILEAEQLLNSQTGEYEDIDVRLEGIEEIDVAGRAVAANRYRMTAKGGDIRLWYSAADATWLALEAPAKGGRVIRYTPRVVPTADDDVSELPSASLVALAD